MADALIVIDSFRIRDGKLGEFKAAVAELVRFVEDNEPDLIAYNVYINEDGTGASGVQVHRDSGSMARHMEVAGSAFPKIMELIEMNEIGVYGKPTDALLCQMRQMRETMEVTVLVNETVAGFARLGDTART